MYLLAWLVLKIGIPQIEELRID